MVMILGIVDMTGDVTRKIYEMHTRKLVRDDMEEALAAFNVW